MGEKRYLTVILRNVKLSSTESDMCKTLNEVLSRTHVTHHLYLNGPLYQGGRSSLPGLRNERGLRS